MATHSLDPPDESAVMGTGILDRHTLAEAVVAGMDRQE